MSTSTTSSISQGEWSVLAELLALVAEQFSYKSSTDYPLAPSDEHKAIVAAAIERVGRAGDWSDDAASWEDYVAAIMAEDTQIIAFMDWMAEHLAARCQLAAAGAEHLSDAEMALIVDMLEVAREDHDEAESLGLVPYAIEQTAANRAVLAQISDETTRPPGQEAQVTVKAALLYFAERCAAVGQPD
jgi:hypothetical protein